MRMPKASLNKRGIVVAACVVGWTGIAAVWAGCSSDPTSSNGAAATGAGGGDSGSSTTPGKDAAASGGGTVVVGDDAGSSTPAPLPTCTMPGVAGEFYALSEENLAATENVPMCDFRDKVVLIVNTASFCGNTPQYAPLERLFQKYYDQGFYILGFPCNQFGGQEPGDAASISTFCTTEYHITFPMFTKINVNAPDQDPLYTWLKAQPGGAGDIDWNFAKFLVGRDGKFIKRWVAATQPDDPDVVTNIETALAAP